MFRLPFSFRFCLSGACLAILLVLVLVALPANASDISWQYLEDVEAPHFLEHGKETALFALAFTGVAYRYGGNSPETGMDCSGFVTYIYKEAFDVALPRTAAEIEQSGMPIDVSELQPGDLLFYNTLGRPFSHVGIYLGDAKFIHSPRAGAQIRIENMRLPYWTQRFNGARRIGVS
jgi:cell wall-associated NlpC family hydrolase